jgi:hypothetical protein
MPCVYILTNSAIPGLLKIGFTGGSASERAAALSRGTGVPTPYEVRWFIECTTTEAAHESEQAVHRALDNHRYNRQREFFTCNESHAIDIITGLVHENGAVARIDLGYIQRQREAVEQKQREEEQKEKMLNAYDRLNRLHYELRGFPDHIVNVSVASQENGLFGSFGKVSVIRKCLADNDFNFEKAINSAEWRVLSCDFSMEKKNLENNVLNSIKSRLGAQIENLIFVINSLQYTLSRFNRSKRLDMITFGRNGLERRTDRHLILDNTLNAYSYIYRKSLIDFYSKNNMFDHEIFLDYDRANEILGKAKKKSSAANTLAELIS